MKTEGRVEGSFRDPSGQLFYQNGVLLRSIAYCYKEEYDVFINSGLYTSLVDTKLLIPHEDVTDSVHHTGRAYKIVQPKIIPFISYSYEWCFSQLQQAALTTLAIQKQALLFGMSLKDASAYNVQFLDGRPIFIDTLSFERYKEGKPWTAYRQFCQHFLAPLALMHYTDIRLNQLLRIYIDGIPADLAASLLPATTWLRFSLLTHIHLHAGSQKHFGNKSIRKIRGNVSRLAMNGIIDNLESTVRKLKWKPEKTVWADYYAQTNYSDEAHEHKKRIVSEFLDQVRPAAVWDFGANTGTFSRLAVIRGIETVSFDMDPAAVEKNYLECLEQKETHILPLLLDLSNPSPGTGWENRERMSLMERGPVEMAFALALVHHLAIHNNLPFHKIASFFSSVCTFLVIEFVPKTDSQVQRMLDAREDIFTDYTREAFEKTFALFFDIKNSAPIKGSDRILYLMEKRS